MKRNLFKELSEALEDIKLYKKGKTTLRQYEVNSETQGTGRISTDKEAGMTIIQRPQYRA